MPTEEPRLLQGYNFHTQQAFAQAQQLLAQALVRQQQRALVRQQQRALVQQQQQRALVQQQQRALVQQPLHQ